MSSETLHRCDFCNDEITTMTGMGFRWVSGRTLERGIFQDVHNHLCLDCIQTITAIGNGEPDPEPAP